MKELNFNSIKVQLRQSKDTTFAGAEAFQFHKGTIKTEHLYHYKAKLLSFQFHKGTIKTNR